MGATPRRIIGACTAALTLIGGISAAVAVEPSHVRASHRLHHGRLAHRLAHRPLALPVPPVGYYAVPAHGPSFFGYDPYAGDVSDQQRFHESGTRGRMGLGADPRHPEGPGNVATPGVR